MFGSDCWLTSEQDGGLPGVFSRGKGVFFRWWRGCGASVAGTDDTATANGEVERGERSRRGQPAATKFFRQGESVDREGAGASARQVPGTRGMLCR